MIAALRHLKRDSRGATIVEFAMCAPILLMALFGMFDLAFNMYASAMLQGAMQKAGRAASIEGATPAKIDAIVTKAVHDVVPGATMRYSRKAYSSFTEVSAPEDYNDVNANGVCDTGEPYEDINGNSQWDADRGMSGMGGARDAVLYEARMSYTRLFPVAQFVGMSNEFNAVGRTVLRNQPWALQNASRTSVKNCA